MDVNVIGTQILDCAFKVHRNLGPGLLESAYKSCLSYELTKNGLKHSLEHPLPLVYEDLHLSVGYRVDIIVEGKIVIELKAVDALNDVHLAQIITYLKLSDCKLGYLINFNTNLLKHGIRRVVNGF